VIRSLASSIRCENRLARADPRIAQRAARIAQLATIAAPR